ncbi:hypothetical protein Ddye_013832 [Dipteronia dyeriana]|uniref:ABC transmembrane type-1 domain-containing protein n=1 Tax=Dipteronia dyeriana TaxID=168575 RepID=A0AAD9X780_9ROSI|nr:hypothetical protein Ddye_013832 [Dipteronia dyeriana]
MNRTTKAPILNYASETSQGVFSIRALNKMDMFFKNYIKLVDTDVRMFFHSWAAKEWLFLRIEALQNLILLDASLLIVLLPGEHLLGFVGLSFSYALTLSTIQVYMRIMYCNLSNDIVSVKRIKQFMHLPPEAPAIIEDMRPPTSWPCGGRIELHDLKIRYRTNAPLVLKGIACTFKEGTRVGVVGRTGNLRTKLSIIPQEPTLFRGSIRMNLDPLGMLYYKSIRIKKLLLLHIDVEFISNLLCISKPWRSVSLKL